MTDESLFRRFWLLALLHGIERAGRAPIELRQLHSLVYLANALSPCYGVEPLDATILKEDDGPMYPEVVWDSDRLVGAGLVAVSNLVVGSGAQVRSASYAITGAGLHLISQCVARSASLSSVARALSSVSLAYARNPRAIVESNLLHRDGNYADPHFGLGDVVDFGEWDRRNASANAVKQISDQSATSRAIAVSVNLYTQYLAAQESTSNA